MCSPIGHGLAGIAVGLISRPGFKGGFSFSLYLYAFFSANVPDLDFLPGLLIGDINRWHHSYSHTLFAALLYTVLALLAARGFGIKKWRLVGWLSLIPYLSHLLLDYLSLDRGAPFGIPLLWPLSDDYFYSELLLFGAIDHGGFGATNTEALIDIFSYANLLVITRELLILGLLIGSIVTLKTIYSRSRPNQDQ
ncbi:MAG: metal-dependent hydrolase [Arenicellales bacterium]|jgi:inner membrane protein|nr:metal-dependent hydrolase [Arenicellales bacterium]|tara:strand:+ start:1040 stop:1621 length:582 start_codon:yes stop_codon:yes gene_type:complete